MHIEWTPATNQSPYLFRQVAVWNGVRVHRAKVLPGRMLDHAAEYHELNIAISGQLTTQKCSSTGKTVITKGGSGSLCLTPYGQTIGAYWKKPLDNMGILLTPDFVRNVAAENRFSADFEFHEIYQDKDPLIEQIGFALLDEAKSDTPVGKLYTDSLIQTLTLHLLKN